MPQQFITYVQDGPVAYLTLNRPEKRNALNRQMLDEFAELSEAAGRDDSVSVIVIRGAGPDFCSGMDLTSGEPARSTDTAVAQQQVHDQIQSRWLALRDLPKPVIAQVHGHCLGVATQICVCADITIVAEDARIGVPGMPNDWFADWWVWRVGASRAKLMTFTVGNQISGAQAERWGFATLAVPRDRLESETERLARWIAQTPLQMLRLKKQALTRAEDAMGFRLTAERTASTNILIAHSDAAQEVSGYTREHGLRATLERFAPPD